MVEKQNYFALAVARLLLKASEMGYLVTLGEAWRSDETAEIYAKEGKGIAKSLHRLRLAIDINLFFGNALLRKSSDYQRLGEWWESQSTEQYKHCWGGRFNDGNHFSIAHEGVR